MTTEAAPARPSLGYAWYVIGVLVLAYTFSYVDRTILTLMVAPIRESLGINDVQVSLLHGLAFAVFYTLLGIPIARYADTMNRVWIISIGIGVWSVMTALCGFARNFAHMFLARIGVGVGEAALGPCAYSIIADYFPADKLSRAMSVYTSAIYVGSGLALILGGAAIAAVPSIDFPGVGTMEPWRVVFLIVGLPGLLVIALMATVREPVRTGLAKGAKAGEGLPVAEVARFITDRRGAYGFMIFGLSAHALMWNGTTGWIPTYFIRTFGWTAPQVGLWFGIVLLIFGTGGVILGGFISSWLRAKGHLDSNLRIGILSCILVLPFGIGAPLISDPWLSMAGIAAFVLCASLPYGCAAAAFQEITPNQMRGQVTAVYFFVLNLAGIGLGPTVVAMFTENVFQDLAAVKYSIASTVALGAPLSAILLWMSLRHYRNVLAAASK